MPDDRAVALRGLRGEQSLRAFVEHLVGHGLKPSSLSRQRLSDVEKGAATLPDKLWDQIADALIHAGHPAARVAPLRATTDPGVRASPSTAPQRLAQWTRVVDRVADSKWWRATTKLLKFATNSIHLPRYLDLVAQHWDDRTRYLNAAQQSLRLGARTAGTWQPSPDDAVAVDRARSTLTVTIDHGELFLLRAWLHNTGSVPWRSRLLYRLGPPVTSSCPFTPGVLPVPDAEPGESVEVLIPGRAQWFSSLAVVSYVLVFPDCTPSLPGRLSCRVDTRTTDPDHSIPLPPGFPDAWPAGKN